MFMFQIVELLAKSRIFEFLKRYFINLFLIQLQSKKNMRTWKIIRLIRMVSFAILNFTNYMGDLFKRDG